MNDLVMKNVILDTMSLYAFMNLSMNAVSIERKLSTR